MPPVPYHGGVSPRYNTTVNNGRGASTSTCQAVIPLQYRNHKGNCSHKYTSSNSSIKTPLMGVMAVQMRPHELNTRKALK